MHCKMNRMIDGAFKSILSAATAACVLVGIPDSGMMTDVLAEEEYVEENNSELNKQPVITTEEIEIDGVAYTIYTSETSSQIITIVADEII